MDYTVANIVAVNESSLNFTTIFRLKKPWSLALKKPIMNHRREIDGLRALAVIPVILFHAGFEAFSGGFIGVDVFFVISGYLITIIIIDELESGKFSICNFYERRARRILPALFLVMAVCIPFAWLWLMPSDMKNFSESLITVSVFLSNIQFWLESGYFDTAVELKPLLHTWSLAVEEQFYLLFPLFLILTWTLGRKWVVTILILIAAASLIGAHWGALNKPAATFFLLFTRSWELEIGSFIAFYSSKRPLPTYNPILNELLSATGLLLIIYSIFIFSKATPFPSFYTLVPISGVALVILFAWPKTFTGTLLGSKALAGFGLISYSAYLWHQPLFAFARHRSLAEPSMFFFIMLSGSSLVLAYFSWRFVEQPFRQNSAINRAKVFYFAGAGSVAFIIFGLMGYLTDGYLFRSSLKENIALLEHRVRVNHGLSSVCDGYYTTSPKCRTDEEPEILLWGDSFAMHLAQGFVASNPKIKLIQMTIGVCGPVLDIAPIHRDYPEAWAKKCIESNDKVFEYIKKSKTIKYVVLSSIFFQYIDWKIFLRTGEIVNGKDYSFQYFRKTLQEIVNLGITPIIVSPTPHTGQNVGRCLVKATRLSQDLALCDLSFSVVKKVQQSVFAFLSQVEREFKVIWLTDAICVEDVCRAAIDNTFIYCDVGHLSHEGSAFLGKAMNFYDLVKNSSNYEK